MDVTEEQQFIGKLEAAKDTYDEVTDGAQRDALSSTQMVAVEATRRSYESNADVLASMSSAVSIGGRLCCSVFAIPTLLPNGRFAWEQNYRAEQLLFDDAIRLALELSELKARADVARRHAEIAETFEADSERQDEIQQLAERRMRDARDARWRYLSPVAAAAFRLAARHPQFAELAQALIGAETEPRRGEVDLPKELDAQLWRLTADSLSDEEREAVGLPRR